MGILARIKSSHSHPHFLAYLSSHYRGIPVGITFTCTSLMNKFLMKLFSTSNMETITYCREQFNFELPSVILARHASFFG